ncbi:hypothetical protein NE237_024104 [Protea cynaroides]|uniref:Transmembrane protein 131-like N-terminal domain-containing protein n=1 Tax=Protea cynaroides TaxID=273540 RepID=A0A9Q0HGB3_9MAGN|nr:hypothetical protein NE237_024104 [Protea cynaroides]
MENLYLAARAEQQMSMFYRRFIRPFDGFHLVLVLSCVFFCLALCGPCIGRNHLISQANGMREHFDSNAYGPNVVNHDAGLTHVFGSDVSSDYVRGNSPTFSSFKNVCTSSEFFCFPSTLPGFPPAEDNFKASLLEVPGRKTNDTLPDGPVPHGPWDGNSSQLPDHQVFKLLNGRLVSCSLNSGRGLQDISSLQNGSVGWDHHSSCRGYRPSKSPNKSFEAIRSGFSGSFSSFNVEIKPPLLDWGQNYLYFPSLAFLTVANTCNDSILHVYEPFSTDSQFYPCDFDDVMLGPGEVASICFVFLPRILGFSSAYLVLQTSSGGYLVHAKGFVIESPYGIEPLIGLEVSSDGIFGKNLSLHNPFNEALYVQQVTAWMSFSSGSTSYSAEAVCRMDTIRGSDEFSYLLTDIDMLNIKSGEVGLPLLGIKPNGSWELDPHNTGTFLEIDFSSCSEGKLVGAFCVELQSSSQGRVDTIIVPLEAEVRGKAPYGGHTGLVSISLEALVPCDSGETIDVALSLRNGAPNLLSVVKISQVADGARLFQIKYMEGLLLFPGTVTQIAVVTYARSLVDTQDHAPEVSNAILNCKLHILTNNSGSPQIEIPCQDVVHTCSKRQPSSYIGYHLHHEEKFRNETTRKLNVGIQSSTQINALETAEADELVLKNWRSQGTRSGLSVLADHEILFPMVQVGTHCSKWITVRNPSDQPVIMQLVLNSGAIIDQCRGADEFVQPLLSSSLIHNESMLSYGFSIAEAAITEAYVHSYERAFLGPIVFHPSNRCGWRSSALIRNNLSGVEWLPLRGFGGSLSLVILDGTEPVKSLEFNLEMPISPNISPAEFLFRIEDTSSLCSEPLLKELYAKNTGDLPLEVKHIAISRTDCQLDGFILHTCEGFALEPGESTRLLISYQTDFSAVVIHRDLELALATGIFIIPMKATLPAYMINLCKKSLSWMLLVKFSMVVFVAASVLFFIFCCRFPQPVTLVALGYLFKSERSPVATVGTAGKSSRKHRHQRNNRFSICCSVVDMLRSVKEDETLKPGLVCRSDWRSGHQGEKAAAQCTKLMQDDEGQNLKMSEPQKEMSLLPSSSIVKSVAVTASSDLLESPQTGNRTVRIRTGKGKKGRKRRGSGAGCTGMPEVSSSQSGNSAPSSPPSPVTLATLKQTWPLSPEVDHAIYAKDPYARRNDRSDDKGQRLKAADRSRLLKSEVSTKYCSNSWLLPAQGQLCPAGETSKAVPLPSATFPCTGWGGTQEAGPSTFLASTSAIALPARAPGSKLLKETTIKAEEKTEFKNEFTYDIWGNHFSVFHLMGVNKKISTTISNASDDDFQSFFLRDPLILMQETQAVSISVASKLLNCPVSCLHQNA